jgi:hypothetical protein
LNVNKATFWMFQSGNAPLTVGSGMGGEGRKSDKGSVIRGKDSVERKRGQKMLDLKPATVKVSSVTLLSLLTTRLQFQISTNITLWAVAVSDESPPAKKPFSGRMRRGP